MGDAPRRPGRVRRDGKHLEVEGVPFRVRGVSYGTFLPRGDGASFPERATLAADLRAIAAAGLNTVRVYTVPPPDLLELAREHDLRLIVGLEYDDWRSEPAPSRRATARVLDAGRRAVAEAMERCAFSQTVLAVSIGNEIPVDVARLHGISAVEEALSRLVDEVHEADPGMLATYTNFPTTEFLQVERQDIVSFNVFLEQPSALRRYLRHLQILAGDTPLLVAELGLAASLHGEDAQAHSLTWQLEAVDEAGCVGATVFAWTDEWAVGGKPVEGWGFGLTDPDRRPKAALEAVSRWARSTVRDVRESWPRISVVVCAYNAEDHLDRCLSSLEACDYPELEVIVCDDGSTDATAEIAKRYPVQLLELAHVGLSAARNAGASAARGEIVAFIDADAYCHSEWPYHLALSFEDEAVAATGGPNLPVPAAGFAERAVAASPGGPIHVLIGDDRAEHVPGCNMAVRKRDLDEIGGFDPIYTAAGDDVDVCWRLLDRRRAIGFAPAAQVFHRRRSSIRGYLAQQRGYGNAERLMAARHPHRFNTLGQARWRGFIYGGPPILRRLLPPVVYHGTIGAAPFQTIVYRRAELARSWFGALLPLAVPLAFLGALAAVSWWWLVAPLLALAMVLAYGVAVAAGTRPGRDETRPLAFRALVGSLHVLQPFARTYGRVFSRARRKETGASDLRWTGDRATWVDRLVREVAARGCAVKVGGDHDPWDLSASLGPLVHARVTTAVLWGWTPAYRVAVRPRLPALVVLLLSGLAMLIGVWEGLAVVTLCAAVLTANGLLLRGRVVSAIEATIRHASAAEPEPPLTLPARIDPSRTPEWKST